MRGGVDGAPFDGLADALNHGRVAVAQDDWPEAQPVVDVPIFIGVEHVAFFGVREDVGVFFAPIAKIRIDAVRKNVLGAVKQLLGARARESHGILLGISA